MTIETPEQHQAAVKEQTGLRSAVLARIEAVMRDAPERARIEELGEAIEEYETRQ